MGGGGREDEPPVFNGVDKGLATLLPKTGGGGNPPNVLVGAGAVLSGVAPKNEDASSAGGVSFCVGAKSVCSDGTASLNVACC